ncbi:MAG: ABC transporter ATP-binding protein, partial [Dehalococcoidia bacterium]|nr:ABC transporter ATP-binding protein [Dehalococcoidia bacterium]
GERGLYGRLTGLENLRYFASLGHLGGLDGRRAANEVLDRVGLSDAADVRVERYSRGMKQRLHVARGLLASPRVLFLDEPTIGIDPIGAQEIRRIVPELAAEGVTVLLTTHYMFEADSLCDRIALIDRGRLVALGTPNEIKREFSNVRVLEVTLREAKAGLSAQMEAVPGVERVDVSMDGLQQKLTATVVAGTEGRAASEMKALVGEGVLETLVTRDPTLEEAYLSILSQD